MWSKKRLNGACLMQYRRWTQYSVELQYSTAQHSEYGMVQHSRTAGHHDAHGKAMQNTSRPILVTVTARRPMLAWRLAGPGSLRR